MRYLDIAVTYWICIES